MDKICRLLVIASLFVCSGCLGQKTTSTQPEPTNQIVPSTSITTRDKQTLQVEDPVAFKVEVGKGKLSINGVEVPAKPEVSSIEKVFGKPSGSNTGGIMNSIYWRDHGFKCLQDKSTMRITNYSFYYGGYYDDDSSAMSKPFKGSFVVNGETIKKATNISELGKKLTLEKGSGDSWLFVSEGGTRVMFDTHAQGITNVHISR